MAVQNVVTPTPDLPRPFEAVWADAGALKTALASCKVALYVNPSPDLPNPLTKEAIEALEANYSGYTAGGNTITAAGDPYVDDEGEVYVTLPLTQFNCTPGTPNVPNQVSGAYVVDDDGVLRGVFPFAAPQRMETLYDSIPVVVSFNVK